MTGVVGWGAVGIAAALVATAAPAWAQDGNAKPITERGGSVGDAITAPVEDLNLKKTRIPEVLQRAISHPYEIEGQATCEAVAEEIARLNELLGPDKDIPRVATAAGPSGEKTAAAVIKAGVTSFIPFRGVVRQITGANDQEEAVENAINAGFSRRGFLRGRAVGMNCAPPASPGWFMPVVETTVAEKTISDAAVAAAVAPPAPLAEPSPIAPPQPMAASASPSETPIIASAPEAEAPPTPQQP